MNFETVKELLSLLLPIAVCCLGIGFVKVVFLKQEGSAFMKIAKFAASVTLGVIAGYITSKFFGKGLQLLFAVILTFLADQATNRIDKTGIDEISGFVKSFIKSRLPTTQSENNSQTPDNG